MSVALTVLLFMVMAVAAYLIGTKVGYRKGEWEGWTKGREDYKRRLAAKAYGADLDTPPARFYVQERGHAAPNVTYGR